MKRRYRLTMEAYLEASEAQAAEMIIQQMIAKGHPMTFECLDPEVSDDLQPQ